MDDISLFADHWVVVRPDGTPILNGTPEQFESSLRDLVERMRSVDTPPPLTSEKQSVEYNDE